MLPSAPIAVPSNALELVRKSIYPNNPVRWVQDKLKATVWSKQRDILNSIRDNRLTVVPSCHGPGKTAVAGMAVCWWIDAHKPGEAVVVTTATTMQQVKSALWKEIRNWHAVGELPGRLNQVQWYLDIDIVGSNGNITRQEKEVAFGRKPADYDQEAFQGIHDPYVLFIGDEASGLPEDLCVAGKSLVANDDSRYLLIGNPLDPGSYFAKCCKPGSGFNVIHISYKDTPNFTNEPVPDNVRRSLIGPIYVDEMRREWGEDHPRYISRVLGRFPTDSQDNLIPYAWVESAVARGDEYDIKHSINRASSSTVRNELGVDVGGGSDWNIIAHALGNTARIILRTREPDTMVQLGHVVKALVSTGANRAKVDYIGIGKGMVDRAREIAREAKATGDVNKYKLYSRIIGVDVRKKASDPTKFVNLRSESYYNLRRKFQDGDIILLEGVPGTRDVLAGQLQAIKTKPTSDGRECVMSKEEMIKKRILTRSCDEADAVNNAFIDISYEKRKRARVIGGRRMKQALRQMGR